VAGQDRDTSDVHGAEPGDDALVHVQATEIAGPWAAPATVMRKIPGTTIRRPSFGDPDPPARVRLS
jgi:hypothetical protein